MLTHREVVVEYKFEHLFKRHILERGEWIATSDDIFNFRKTASTIQADVRGTDWYKIEILLVNDEIHDMSCTCPYAESGDNCKHMAAVLIYAGESDLEEQTDDEVISEVLSSISKDEIIVFIKEQLGKNEKLNQDFMLRFISSSVNVSGMVDEFLSLIEIHGGRDGFINYYRAREFFRDIDEYTERLKDMLDQGLYLETIKVIAGVAEGFDNISLDDSDGGTSLFYDDIEELMIAITHSKEQEAVDFAFEWMSKLMEGENDWYLRERLHDVWMSSFSNEEYRKKQIEILENKLDLENRTIDQRENDYRFISELISYANLLLERGDSHDNIIKMMKEYKEESSIMIWLIDMARSRMDFEEELLLIKEGIADAKECKFFGLRQSYKKMLCDYYKRMEQTDQYMETLRELVLESTQSIDWWNEYREKFMGDWPEEREALIRKLMSGKSPYYVMYAIYARENMLENLMDLIERHGNEFQLDEYYHSLVPYYSERMIDFYCKRLDNMLTYAGNRNKYRAIIFRLKKIGKISGGEEIIKRKVAEYKVKYNRRTALMDEMGKAGL